MSKYKWIIVYNKNIRTFLTSLSHFRWHIMWQSVKREKWNVQKFVNVMLKRKLYQITGYILFSL